MPKEKKTLVYGTLEMLTLQSLVNGPLHGLGIADRIHVVSRAGLSVQDGSLYPALHRLVGEGLVKVETRVTENNRQGRYYALTPAGRKRLSEEKEQWLQVSGAVNLVLSNG